MDNKIYCMLYLTTQVRPLCKSMTNANHEISIDFWEQYDPAEVGATGFALITSEIFNIPAICFLCGSAGKELVCVIYYAIELIFSSSAI